MNKHLALSGLIFLFVIIATVAVISIGKGYRFGFNTGKIEIAGTGLLVLKSTPDSAQVFVNGHLTTATNNTINLSPATYTIKIQKNGYFPWEKKVIIQAEAVSQANAQLLPIAPKLESITDKGVGSPTIDPSQTRIAYTISSQSAKLNGIYVTDTSSRPILTLQNDSTQIADDTFAIFSQAKLTWSPDGKQILASISAQIGAPTYYLLRSDQFNSAPSDVTEILPTVMAGWNKDKVKIDQARINSVPPQLRSVIKNEFAVLVWSPDETKILYIASESATIPLIITPRLIGTNSTPEQREIKKGEYYVYDIKEDRNYSLPSENFAGAYSWFPDSNHFIYVKDQKINFVDSDGKNNTVFFAGPFDVHFLFPWSDGTRVVILTNLGNLTIAPNLYTISLK